jgi:hypothetical protein
LILSSIVSFRPGRKIARVAVMRRIVIELVDQVIGARI